MTYDTVKESLSQCLQYATDPCAEQSSQLQSSFTPSTYRFVCVVAATCAR